MIDRDSFGYALEHLAEVLGQKLTEKRIDAYYVTFRNSFNVDTFADVCRRAAEDCDRFPVPKVLLAMRGAGQIREHKCELCADTPGWVYGREVRQKAGNSGAISGGEVYALRPCPRRTDGRANAWYADEAERNRLSPEEERERATAHARTAGKLEAARLLGRIDPAGTLLSAATKPGREPGEDREDWWQR